MEAWHSQRYLDEGRKAGIAEEVLQRAVATAEYTLACPDPGPPILTLGHLAQLCAVETGILRSYIARLGNDPYREFRVRKRPVAGEPPRYRFIAVPEPKLLQAQTWIARNILRHAPCHDASTAYAPGSRLAEAARRHCCAQWMIKIDVRDFFEALTEIDAHRVFRERGYQPLVALELARLCTRLRDKHRESGSFLPMRRRPRWKPFDFDAGSRDGVTSVYPRKFLGVIPQGAPTSPMLANLAVRDLDEALSDLATQFGLRYSRYADDLTFSTNNKTFGRSRANHAIGEVYQTLVRRGLSPNRAKTNVVPPGSRKIVLGLLVDGSKPRLTREFRDRLRMHMHYITVDDGGPAHHARARGFTSVEGLRQHLLGLIAFAGQIDAGLADRCRQQMRRVDWSVPIETSR